MSPLHIITPWLIFIVFALLVLWLMSYGRRIVFRVCAALFGFAVICGFPLYTYVYLTSDADFFDTLFASLRGIYGLGRMFSLSDEWTHAVSGQNAQWLTENVVWQILLWLCHVAALVVLQAALFTAFGRRLVDSLRIRFGRQREVFIIKGCDKNALMLGENIATHDNPKGRIDRKRLIVFILEEDDDEKAIVKKIAHFNGIAKMLDGKIDLPCCLKKIRMGKRNRPWVRKKHHVILMPQMSSVVTDMQKVIETARELKMPGDELNIYAFTESQWDRDEIEEISQMKEEGQRRYPYTFHIISEVELLTRKMIRKRPPFKSPRLGFERGVAAKPFKALIVGFGKVGQSALLRLVMNGQFVTVTEGKMQAVIVDKDADVLKDCFMHRHPSLSLCCEMRFESFDARCDSLYTLLDAELDYIVVALYEDEMNKRIAKDIELYYGCRKREELPFIAVPEEDSWRIHEGGDGKIFKFGCREEIYTEAEVIRENIDILAKAINETYRKEYGGEPWSELDCDLQESNRAPADFIPAMLYLVDPDLTEEAAMDMDTLTVDQGMMETLAKTEHLRWNAFHIARGYLPISIAEMRERFEEYGDAKPDERLEDEELEEKRLKNHRNKRLNHARRDSKLRLQVCLVPWEKLDAVSAAYRELEKLAGGAPKRDFKDNDRDVVKFIPKFLKEAREADSEGK